MAENANESTPRKRKFRITWLLLGMGILTAAGGLTFLSLRYFKGNVAVAATGHKAEKGTKEEVRSTLNLDPFLVNLADKSEIRFVKASFRLGLADEKGGEQLSKNMVFLAATRDAIISLLSSKTAEQILSQEGKELLRQEIQTRVNALIPKGKVQEVYIVDFVVQL